MWPFLFRLICVNLLFSFHSHLFKDFFFFVWIMWYGNFCTNISETYYMIFFPSHFCENTRKVQCDLLIEVDIFGFKYLGNTGVSQTFSRMCLSPSIRQLWFVVVFVFFYFKHAINVTGVQDGLIESSLSIDANCRKVFDWVQIYGIVVR